MAYTDEYLLSLAHLGPAVVGPTLRAEIEACQQRTNAQDMTSTVLGPAILGTPKEAVEPPAPKRKRRRSST